jgi:hypothetical protein
MSKKTIKPAKSKTNQFNKSKAAKIAATAGVVFLIFLALGGYKIVRQAYYSYKAGSVHQREFSKLSEPLARFGYKNAKSSDPQCTVTQIYGYGGDSLLCNTNQNQYKEIGKDKAAFVASAEQLDALLNTNGWKTESSSAKNFTEWINAVTSGTDYNTDINATKSIGNAKCIVIMTVAYSNPKPPAINTTLGCNTPDYPQASATITLPQ